MFANVVYSGGWPLLVWPNTSNATPQDTNGTSVDLFLWDAREDGCCGTFGLVGSS